MKLLLINTDLRLKLIFDILTVSCDVSVRSVVNRVREIAGIGTEFFHVEVGIMLCTYFKINSLIRNTCNMQSISYVLNYMKYDIPLDARYMWKIQLLLQSKKNEFNVSISTH